MLVVLVAVNAPPVPVLPLSLVNTGTVAFPLKPGVGRRFGEGFFMTLLGIQFPVTKQYHEPLLKNAQDYADRLAVHVNSLNRTVKEVTGKLVLTPVRSNKSAC